MMSKNSFKLLRWSILLIVGGLHVLLLVFLQIQTNNTQEEDYQDANVMKLVDIHEYEPPQEEVLPPPPVEKKIINENPETSEQVVAIEDKLEVVDTPIKTSTREEVHYLPQHKISKVPIIPLEKVLSRIVYPPMALRQEIEDIVYLELYIDQKGVIRRIDILKDPGHGFAESAIKAFQGIQCIPAEANGKTVPVRYRYPIRFTLK
ncbi:energy transducer TonB [Spirochaeta cellobiosiphila]|uniref:energy transducer TonB n=1 Tax=Spirochaeta cellobiosiphila TaxID=504483 RepID=UPI00069FA180|nr:energy transducer TonB [Spirochaeta cellobiosiphila]